MPWITKEIHKMRQEFIEYLLYKSSCMAEACKQFNISRRTGYKWKERFELEGIIGLQNRSKSPKKSIVISNALIFEIVKIRNLNPTWGARKILHRLKNLGSFANALPSPSTVNRVLKSSGLITTKRRRHRPSVQNKRLDEALEVLSPNDEWSIDYKGWWMSKDGMRKCQPLTIRDSSSKYILCIELTKGSAINDVKDVMIKIFKKYGLPKSIRSDNGSPFASYLGLLGLTQLSAWWISLGIKPIRTRPGCPQDNGAHERMHADMKRELQDRGADTQREMNNWKKRFNYERPHDALNGDTPSMHYYKSIRAYNPYEKYLYEGMLVRSLCAAGYLSYEGFTYSISLSLAKQTIGVKVLDNNLSELHFCRYVLGVIDSTTHEFTPTQEVEKGKKRKTVQGVIK